jgi:pimeloyl-ACP methyl ester carboxylesterase
MFLLTWLTSDSELITARMVTRGETRPGRDPLRIISVAIHRTPAGAVLVLPGGKPTSIAPSRARQLANLRMTLLSSALRHRLRGVAEVRQVRYRLRGWNAPRLDAMRDAQAALADLLERFEPARIVLVGHSMGGRVAAGLATRGDLGGVVALAPWWPDDDASLIPAGARLLTIHGTADTWTDPESSRRQCLCAAERGVNARWVGVPGAGHYLLRDLPTWHRLTAQFAAAILDPRGDVELSGSDIP